MQRLQRCVGGPDERTAWILFLRLDGIDNRFVRRHLVVVLRLGHQQTFSGFTRDVRQGNVRDTFWPHELRLQTRRTRLTQDLPHFRVVAAVVNEIDVFFLQTRDQGREVFLTGGDTVKEHHVGVRFFQVILHRTGQAFAVLLFVMNNRDALRLHFFHDVFRGGWPLIGVQTGGTQDQLIAARGELWRRRGRCDHQNAFVFVDVRRGLGGRGAQVTNNVFDPVVYHFVRHRDRLFWVTGIVIFYDLQLFALDAALSINVCNRLFRARKFLVAVLCYRTGHRTHHGHFNIGLRHGAECQRDTSCQ